MFGRHLDELFKTGALPDHEVVADHDRKGFALDHLFRAEHRMAEAELFLLAYGHDVDHFGHPAHDLEHLQLSGALKHAFKLKVVIEVVLDHALVPVGHENDVLHAAPHGLLHDVLHHGLVVDGQHFLGDVLAGGQRTGSPTSDRNDDLANIHKRALLSRKIQCLASETSSAGVRRHPHTIGYRECLL